MSHSEEFINKHMFFLYANWSSRVLRFASSSYAEILTSLGQWLIAGCTFRQFRPIVEGFHLLGSNRSKLPVVLCTEKILNPEGYHQSSLTQHRILVNCILRCTDLQAASFNYSLTIWIVQQLTARTNCCSEPWRVCIDSTLNTGYLHFKT